MLGVLKRKNSLHGIPCCRPESAMEVTNLYVLSLVDDGWRIIYVYSLKKYHLENGTCMAVLVFVENLTKISWHCPFIPLASINCRKNTISSILTGSACALRTVRGRLRRLYIFLWFQIYSHKTQKTMLLHNVAQPNVNVTWRNVPKRSCTQRILHHT
jgi:hypothetical protein